MKRSLGSVLLLFAAMQFWAAGVVAAASQTYSPDEIIVKFRRQVADAVQQQLKPNGTSRTAMVQGTPGNLRLSQNLDRLNSKYKARRIRRVFENFSKKDLRRELLKQKNQGQLLTTRQKHLLTRLERAPKDVKAPDLDRIYRIKLDVEPGQSIEEVLEAYRSDPNIEYAELNHIVRICYEPNDTRYGSQWALKKISAPEGWDIYTGSSEVIVAVIDTGVDYNHRDLSSNMWVNQDERDGLEGVDDDNNGYIDDVYGYNFVYNNSDPMDDHGHGTHCAGIIAAVTNNGFDTAGVCWNSKIMALKFLGSEGEGSTADVVPAFYYAVANGADVLSNSWGGDDESKLLEETINFAHSQGVIMVAAAGNRSSDRPGYPAAYDNMISVAATDSSDKKWSLSNFGDWVDLAAPGVDIVSLRAAGTNVGSASSGYTTSLSGTSMACPHVAGACAMLLSLNPYLTYGDLYKFITATGDKIEEGICASNSRLNLSKAMAAAVPPKGYLTFDKDYYRSSSNITLLLADSDLKGTSSRSITFYTSFGDCETIALEETDGAFGVFKVIIPTDSADPNPYDGIIQIADNDVVAAMYFDADNGSRIPAAVVADAIVDDTPADVLIVETATNGPVAEIQILANEATHAEILYSDACGGPYTILEDIHTGPFHKFRLASLKINTTYYFLAHLIDPAGNQSTADSNGLCYSFTTDANFPGFLVPSVYNTIQDAIDSASDGDIVWVADGVYSGDGNHDIDFYGKAITLRSENGSENTTIDCQSEGRAFLFHYGEDQNSILDGFTIKNGRGGTYGGAIRCTASSPTITNCRFAGNAVTDFGGAIHNSYGSSPTISGCSFIRNWTDSEFCKYGNGGAISNLVGCNPIITDCTFIENVSDYSGGAIYNDKNSSPRITGCSFTSNQVGNPEYDKGFGGAIFNDNNSNPTISNCIFEKNYSSKDAGGIYNSNSSHSIVTNCFFARNSADTLGGAIKNFNADATLVNCTIVSNSAQDGSAIWKGPDSTVLITDTIIWANTHPNDVPDDHQILNLIPMEKTDALYCCIQESSGDYEGMGNISLDPLFVDVNNGDFHLQSSGWRWDSHRKRWHYDFQTSPCIDAGNPGRPLGDEPTSINDDPNNTWAINLRINMGAYGRTVEASMPPHNWALLADITNDGTVSFDDYAVQLTNWLLTGSDRFADLDRDGIVGFADLACLASEWLQQVKPPVVEIVSPADGAFFSIWPIEIPVTAKASDINGSVVKVEFLADGEVFATDTDPDDGWSAVFTHDKGGRFDIVARATDNSAATTISPPVHIKIIPPRH